jgi:hypothetical protein
VCAWKGPVTTRQDQINEVWELDHHATSLCDIHWVGFLYLYYPDKWIKRFLHYTLLQSQNCINKQVPTSYRKDRWVQSTFLIRMQVYFFPDVFTFQKMTSESVLLKKKFCNLTLQLVVFAKFDDFLNDMFLKPKSRYNVHELSWPGWKTLHELWIKIKSIKMPCFVRKYSVIWIFFPTGDDSEEASSMDSNLSIRFPHVCSHLCCTFYHPWCVYVAVQYLLFTHFGSCNRTLLTGE